MKTKVNHQKALKLLSKGHNVLMYTESKMQGSILVSNGHIIITVPAFEFNKFTVENTKIKLNLMPSFLDIMEEKREMKDIMLTTLEITFLDGEKATIFKSKSGKFLSCVNSKNVEIVQLTGYGDYLNYCKAIDRKNPIIYNDGLGCGFAILPINIDIETALKSVLDVLN